MEINKKDLDAFCENLEDLESQKKALADEIKDCIEAFAINQEITKKSVAKFFKEWKEANKDKDDYVLVDYESDQLILIAFPELGGTPEPIHGD